MKILFPSYELVEKQPIMSDEVKKELNIWWKEKLEKDDEELIRDLTFLLGD